MFKISKQFFFEFGHRVWTQDTGAGNPNKCRMIHGHSGMIEVFLESEDLNEGMVIDFYHLGFLKTFIDKYLDHRFLIHHEDPLLNDFINLGFNDEYAYEILSEVKNTFGKLIPSGILPSIIRPIWIEGDGRRNKLLMGFELSKSVENSNGYQLTELMDSLVILQFIPTAENLSRWIYGFMTYEFYNLDINISSVIFRETQKAKSEYHG